MFHITTLGLLLCITGRCILSLEPYKQIHVLWVNACGNLHLQFSDLTEQTLLSRVRIGASMYAICVRFINMGGIGEVNMTRKN